MQFPEEGQCHGAPLPAPVPLFGLGGGPHFFLTRGHGGQRPGELQWCWVLLAKSEESPTVSLCFPGKSAQYDCLPEVMLFREVSLSALGVGATDGAPCSAGEPRAGSAEPPNPGPGGRGSNISQGVLLPFPSPTPGTQTKLKPL